MSVSDITSASSAAAKAAVAKAKQEIAEETLRKGVELLKTKLRAQAQAKLVYDNITREIEELTLQIEQGAV